MKTKAYKWLRRATGLIATFALLFSQVGYASARIIFQDDTLHYIQSDGIRVNEGSSDYFDIAVDGTDIDFTLGGSVDSVDFEGGIVKGTNWSINADGDATVVDVTATGAVNLSGASETRIREVTDISNTNDDACTTVGEIVLDLATDAIFVCTATGADGTWVSADDSPANGTTDNAMLKWDSGTSQWVEQTGITADDSNNLSVSGTINGTTLSTTALDFQGNATIGTNDDTLAIATSDWDIGTDGAMTGFSFDANGTGNSISNIDNADLSDDTIDWDKISDAMTLDAATDIDLQALTLSTSGTGALDFNSTGAVTFAGAVTAESTLDATGLASLDGGIDVDGAFTVADTTGAITTSGATALNGGLTMDTTAFTVADTTGNVHTDGDLDVDGATTLDGAVTLGDAATDGITVTGEVLGASPLAFEGTTNDDVYTTFAITDPTLARTVTFPDRSGTVSLSGDTFTGDVTGTIDTDGSTALTIATDAVQDDEIDYTAVTLADFTNDLALTDTYLFVGNGSNVATGVAMSGDVTITNAGVTTVADDSHNHIITNIDAFTEAELETQLSNVSALFTNNTTGDVTISGDVSTIGADTVDDTMVNWGVGAGTVSAADVPIEDTGGDFTATDVEGALTELAGSVGTDVSNLQTEIDAIETASGGIFDTDGTYLGATTFAGTNYMTGDTDLGTELIALDSQVGTNTGNISTNAGDISTNAGNISSNASAISTNQGNISTNASDISTIETNIGNQTYTNDYQVTDGESVTSSIDALDTAMGDVSTLTTTATDLAAAINELDSDLGTVEGFEQDNIHFEPEYPNLVIDDASTGNGMLEADFVANLNNAYMWTSQQTGSLQTIRMITAIELPEDFSSLPTNGVTISYNTTDTTATDNVVDVYLKKGATTCDSSTGLVNDDAVVDDWETVSLDNDGATCTLGAGDEILVVIDLKAYNGSGNVAYAGPIELTYSNGN